MVVQQTACWAILDMGAPVFGAELPALIAAPKAS
jgi:hypothetical protein